MSNSESRRAVRVLIAEPDDTVARLCARALTHERLEIQRVASPDEMWELLREGRPQFFLIGDEFGDRLGLELVGELRAHTNAPILMVTPTDSVGYLANCLQAGADDVMVRPIVNQLLLARVQAMLRRAYRYSVPPRVAPPPKPLAPKFALPEERTPGSDFKQWPKCADCGHSAPRDRFEGVDEDGRPVVMCPSCYSSKISEPVAA